MAAPFAERAGVEPDVVAAPEDETLDLNESLEDFRVGRTVTHEEAMGRIRATLDKHKKQP